MLRKKKKLKTSFFFPFTLTLTACLLDCLLPGADDAHQQTGYLHTWCALVRRWPLWFPPPAHPNEGEHMTVVAKNPFWFLLPPGSPIPDSAVRGGEWRCKSTQTQTLQTSLAQRWRELAMKGSSWHWRSLQQPIYTYEVHCHLVAKTGNNLGSSKLGVLT